MTPFAVTVGARAVLVTRLVAAARALTQKQLLTRLRQIERNERLDRTTLRRAVGVAVVLGRVRVERHFDVAGKQFQLIVAGDEEDERLLAELVDRLQHERRALAAAVRLWPEPAYYGPVERLGGGVPRTPRDTSLTPRLGRAALLHCELCRYLIGAHAGDAVEFSRAFALEQLSKAALDAVLGPRSCVARRARSCVDVCF